MASLTLLGGCESKKKLHLSDNKVSVVDQEEKNKQQREAERMQQCQHELEAMRNMDPEKYQKFKREFDALMSGAAQYAGMRAKVNADTQETVDALYRYRTNRTCADISATMMTGLAERGERTQ